MLVRTDFDSSLVFFINEASARGEWYSCSKKESDKNPIIERVHRQRTRCVAKPQLGLEN